MILGPMVPMPDMPEGWFMFVANTTLSEDQIKSRLNVSQGGINAFYYALFDTSLPLTPNSPDLIIQA